MLRQASDIEVVLAKAVTLLQGCLHRSHLKFIATTVDLIQKQGLRCRLGRFELDLSMPPLALKELDRQNVFFANHVLQLALSKPVRKVADNHDVLSLLIGLKVSEASGLVQLHRVGQLLVL